MPTRPPRPCAVRSCPNLVHGPGYLCETHQAEHERAYEKQRGGSSQRGYGARWRRLRGMVLAQNPICADPFGIHKTAGQIVPATDVDHIIPRSQGGTDAFDNLQALCHECHSRKTMLTDGGLGKINQKISGGQGDNNLSKFGERDRCGSENISPAKLEAEDKNERT